MAFNAGGTNVGGVQSRPQGNLTIQIGGNIGVNATGSFDKEFTVPANKIWNLKATETYSNAFSGTLSFNYVYFIIGSNSFTLKSTGTSATNQSLFGDQNIFLKAGDKIRIRVVCTVYTSGDIGTNVVVHESDV